MSGNPGYTLSEEHLRKMYAQARAEFPKECCGYIQGSSEGLVVVACTNYQDRMHAMDPETYPRTSERAYTIQSKDLLKLSHSFESEFPAKVIYHSHPRVGAYFSDEDVAAANAAGWPVDYLVIDAQEDGVHGSVLYRRDGDTYVEIARYPGLAT